jgi:hypothetical protein
VPQLFGRTQLYPGALFHFLLVPDDLPLLFHCVRRCVCVVVRSTLPVIQLLVAQIPFGPHRAWAVGLPIPQFVFLARTPSVCSYIRFANISTCHDLVFADVVSVVASSSSDPLADSSAHVMLGLRPASFPFTSAFWVAFAA